MKENNLTNNKDLLINLLRKKFDDKLKQLESRTNYQFSIIYQTSNMVNSITNTCIELNNNLKEKEKEENQIKKRNTLKVPINPLIRETLISKNYTVKTNKNSIVNKPQLKNEKNEKLGKSKSNGNLLLIHNSKNHSKKNEKNTNTKTRDNSKSKLNNLNSSINSNNKSQQFSLKRSKTERQLTKKGTNHTLLKTNKNNKSSNNNLSISKDKVIHNNSNSKILQNSEILSKTFDENRLLTMESTIQSGLCFIENDPLLVTPITDMDFIGKNNLLLNSHEIEENYHLKKINFYNVGFDKNNLITIIEFLNIKDYSNLKLVNKLYNKKVNEVILIKLKEEKSKYENKINLLKKEKNLISNEKILNLNLSKTTLKAMNLLNQPLLNKLFNDSNKIPSDDILLIYHIYFQLINHPLSKEFENKKVFWEKCCNYFTKESNGKTGDILLKNSKENLDLTDENIYKVIHIVDKKVKIICPGYFSKTCGTTSLFIFFIKDILDFLGITNNRKICDNSLWTCKSMVNVIDKKIEKINTYCKHFA